MSTAHAPLVLQHAENLSFGLVVGHAAHRNQLDATLVTSLSPLLKIVTLALIHYQDYAVVHGRERGLLVREAWWIHLKLCLADVRFVLRNGITATRVSRGDVFVFTGSPSVAAVFGSTGPAAS